MAEKVKQIIITQAKAAQRQGVHPARGNKQ